MTFNVISNHTCFILVFLEAHYFFVMVLDYYQGIIVNVDTLTVQCHLIQQLTRRDWPSSNGLMRTCCCCIAIGCAL